LIRRAAGDVSGGNLRGGSTVCIRRGEEPEAVFGLSRDTIAKMCRYSAPPGYVRSKVKLGPLVPVIDAILEADKTRRRRATDRTRLRWRLYVVKDYVRIARSAIAFRAPRKIGASLHRANQVQGSHTLSAGGWHGTAWLLRFEPTLTEKNDPLVAIAAMVPFESFRPKLHTALIKRRASQERSGTQEFGGTQALG
jgi:hypothetical protein